MHRIYLHRASVLKEKVSDGWPYIDFLNYSVSLQMCVVIGRAYLYN